MYEIYIHENVMMKPIKIYKKIEKLAVTMSKNIGKLAYEEFIEFCEQNNFITQDTLENVLFYASSM
jgi:hypothetical protein